MGKNKNGSGRSKKSNCSDRCWSEQDERDLGPTAADPARFFLWDDPEEERALWEAEASHSAWDKVWLGSEPDDE